MTASDPPPVTRSSPLRLGFLALFFARFFATTAYATVQLGRLPQGSGVTLAAGGRGRELPLTETG